MKIEKFAPIYINKLEWLKQFLYKGDFNTKELIGR